MNRFKCLVCGGNQYTAPPDEIKALFEQWGNKRRSMECMYI